LAEEKRALEAQMLRENAIRQAEEQSIEVSMSVEERKRLELQEHAINMAKEHPEDVAQLIRTWLRRSNLWRSGSDTGKGGPGVRPVRRSGSSLPGEKNPPR
jgi:hypothetical protein